MFTEILAVFPGTTARSIGNFTLVPVFRGTDSIWNIHVIFNAKHPSQLHQYFQINNQFSSNKHTQIISILKQCIESQVKTKLITAFSISLNNLPKTVQEPEAFSLREESKRWKTTRRVEAANSI